ncbi:hypothetical protein [Clostridium sp. HCS.1]|uniref:hypothetical protein n=1 Tax=Clostridium sp. HCS.1 TaxID=3238594 RepID=UPI003A0FD974
MLLVLSSILFGCQKADTVSIIESRVNTEQRNEINEDMKNIIAKKNEINIDDNSKSIIDLELRNNSLVKEYSQSIRLVKDFSISSSLELIFEEPIQHRISRMGHYVNRSALLQELQLSGAETVSYFTNEDILNSELSIVEEDSTYSHIVYKASITNINENFNFKESKLNEFRSLLIENSELSFDTVDKYIKDIINNRIDRDKVFFNKIDDDRYETIRIENNNCYYKLIYNPKI